MVHKKIILAAKKAANWHTDTKKGFFKRHVVLNRNHEIRTHHKIKIYIHIKSIQKKRNYQPCSPEYEWYGDKRKDITIKIMTYFFLYNESHMSAMKAMNDFTNKLQRG